MPPSPSSESRARSLDQAERTEEKGCGVTTHQKQIPNGTLRKEREREFWLFLYGRGSGKNQAE